MKIERNFKVTIAACLTMATFIVHAKPSPEESLAAIASEYVKLGLIVSQNDSLQYLYFGDQQWLKDAKLDKRGLPELQVQLGNLREQLDRLTEFDDSGLLLRRTSMHGKLSAMMGRINILLGKMPTSFDDETQQLFGVTVPRYSEDHFLSLINQLDEIIPGSGDLTERMQAFREQFVIPVDKLQVVMDTAAGECRKRTKQHISLPHNEGIEVKITQDKPWVGFTFFLGNAKSDIYINQDVPVHLERAIELGCHEAYPGHHVNATLVESELVKKRGWIENSFHVLYGPAAIIAEGAANYGVDLAFTREERIEFEKRVITPLAGIKNDDIELYYQYFDLLDQLNYARNEVARRYLYEGMPREEAVRWLMKHGLETQDTASQRLDFIDALRTYVISYNYGKEIVRQYIEREAGEDRSKRWQKFAYVISNPVSPSDLR